MSFVQGQPPPQVGIGVSLYLPPFSTFRDGTCQTCDASHSTPKVAPSMSEVRPGSYVSRTKSNEILPKKNGEIKPARKDTKHAQDSFYDSFLLSSTTSFFCKSLSVHNISWNVGLDCGWLQQQLSIREAHSGSTSFGISSRRFMNPTAPITCIGLRSSQGIFSVIISHNTTP